MPYKGPERRIHTVFSTRNREYHVRSGICVAVRDRKTQVWIPAHEAIGMCLEILRPGEVFVGHPLFFGFRLARVRTSYVTDIFRPGRQLVNTYNLIWALNPA